MPKVYEVKVRSTPDESALARLRAGIRLASGEKLASCKIELLREEGNSWYKVTLTQGKNRQIREMFRSIGRPVLKLRRTRIGFFSDGVLPIGHYRHITRKEVERLLNLVSKSGKES